MQAWRQLCEKYEFNTVHQPTAGGKERFYSVRNGLELIPDNCLVGIHDGVRPIISKRLIINTFQAAEQTGNAIPAIPLAESARILEDDGALAIPRERIRIIQTPQVFHSTLIKEAYRQPYQEEFTDDATVFETAGHTVHMVEGDPRNIKITRPEDLAVAEVLLQQLLH
jgi:2-C-methyl-D-erythritol 4-phosphate cytidylyltransferase